MTSGLYRVMIIESNLAKRLAKKSPIYYNIIMLLLVSLYCHPMLLMLHADFNLWAYERKLPVVITRSFGPELPQSTSDTHSTCRAIDYDTTGWSIKDIDAALKYMNNGYKSVAALSERDLTPQAMIYHCSPRCHLHLQIHKRYARSKEANLEN